MGDHVKDILRKLSQGENFRFEDEEDEALKELTMQLRANPQTELGAGYKKITERAYHLNSKVTYQNAKVLPQAYVDCYELVN